MPFLITCRSTTLFQPMPRAATLVTDSLSTVNQQLAEAEADRIVKEARYKMAQTRNPELLMSVAPGTILGSLRDAAGPIDD